MLNSPVEPSNPNSQEPCLEREDLEALLRQAAEFLDPKLPRDPLIEVPSLTLEPGELLRQASSGT